MSVSDILRYLEPQECDMTISLVPTGDAYCETPFWFVAPFQNGEKCCILVRG